MRTRDAVLQYQKTLDDAGTLIEPINLTDPVSAFYLEFQATNGSTSNKNNFISDVITKIEIVDGSEVIYSANLFELEALHFYKLGYPPVLAPSEWASTAQKHACLLMFGNTLWDPNYAVDFTRYKNPQLKITSNLAAVRAVSATTAFATGTLKASIIAKTMEETPAPGKFLMARQIEAFTSAASGEKRIELPTDRTYRMALMRAYIEGSDIDAVITDLKHTLDTDKYITFNRKVQQLDAETFARFGQITYKHGMFQNDADVIRVLPNKSLHFAGNYYADDAGLMVGAAPTASSDITLTLFSATAVAVTADTQVSAAITGHALHATLPVIFGNPESPSTWFDPTTFNKSEFVLTQGTANAVVSILLEQVRTQ